MRKIVILGASGHARVIADIVNACDDKVEAFLDDNTDIKGVAGVISEYINYTDCEFIIGIGNANIREKLSNLPVKWYTAIHPSAVVSPSVSIGQGTVIMPNAVINAETAIGEHCIINTSVVVGHDNIIEDFVHVSSGAKLGGATRVGKATWIGIGATVINNINICEECMIGAGAVVVRDIEIKGTYVGIPAKILGGGINKSHNFNNISYKPCCFSNIKEAA